MVSGWERLAAFEGGTVTALATATASDGTRHVFAGTPVGVFRSIDRGRTWSPLGTGRRVAGVEAVAPSPRYAEDGIVYAGGYEGLFRWRDGGEGWEHLLTGSRVLAVACTSVDPDARANDSGLTVLVGTIDDGILISRNGGRAWEGSNAGLISLCVFDLALSPSFAEDGTAFAAMADGVYRTRNGAESWRQLDLGTEDDGFESVAVSPTFSDDRLVLTTSYDVGVYRSDDAGRSWTHLEQLDAWPAIRIASLQRGGWGLASEIGLLISEDGDQTWLWGGQPHDSVDAMALDKDLRDPALCVVRVPGDDGAEDALLVGRSAAGVVRFTADGRSWAPSSAGLTSTLVTNLVLSPDFDQDQTVYAVQPPTGLLRSQDGGRTWTSPNGDGADESTIVPSELVAVRVPGGDVGLYAATGQGLQISQDGGQTWQRAEHAPIYGRPIEDVLNTGIQAVAVASSEAGASILVMAQTGQGLEWMLGGSDDGGVSWYPIPTPLKDTFAQAIAVSPTYRDDGTLYVATHRAIGQTDRDDLIVWRTSDRGRRWDRWFEVADLPGQTAVRVVALPPNRFGDTVVLGVGGRVLRPRRNSWENEGGARRPVWDDVDLLASESVGGLAAVTGLAASPAYAEDRTLFVATSAGVYLSRDGGATFSAWSDGLDPVATVAVRPSPAYAADRLVYALGLGGTIWRRQDQ